MRSLSAALALCVGMCTHAAALVDGAEPHTASALPFTVGRRGDAAGSVNVMDVTPTNVSCDTTGAQQLQWMQNASTSLQSGGWSLAEVGKMAFTRGDAWGNNPSGL
jgi:hypothetical protein